MAETVKVLGQVDVAASTQTTLYTVPGATQCTVSTLHVCNRNASTVHFRARINVAGAADDNKQFLYFDTELSKNESFSATLGLTLGAADVVKVQADSTGVCFSLFGAEFA